ncbi:hypothetical protein [Anaerotruncus rubiinfantis]|uniref:hypothetical protein n=1 Tax=Anaerotruncus rubiinfantis TaxID=1720200 RepID=UPI003D79951C
MFYLALGFVIIFCYKIASNASYLFAAKRYRKIYHDYLSGKGGDIVEHVPSIEKLMSKANVEDKSIPAAQPIGYMQVATYTASVITNISSLRADIACGVDNILLKTIGTFKMRLLESFSPVYWLDTIIFLPREIFKYFGADSNSIGGKVLQLLWWILAPIAIIFRENLIQFILSFFGNL